MPMRQGQAAVSDLAGLAGLAPQVAAACVAVAGDIALVLGDDGLVHHVALGQALGEALGDALALRHCGVRVGRALADSVSRDTRNKIDLLLAEVGRSGLSRPREVNLRHRDLRGLDIPVSLAAVRLGAQGPVLAVGRDLRRLAELQQRVVAAQQALEQQHWQQRQADARYRLLFQVASDAVLVVDADTLAIVEANRAAALLLGQASERLVGRSLLAGLAGASRLPVAQLVAAVRDGGQPADTRARLGEVQAAQCVALVDLALTPLWAPQDPRVPRLLLVRGRRCAPAADTAANTAAGTAADSAVLPQPADAAPRTWSADVDLLAAQLGRVSLPELMQQANHLSERHLIRAALQRAQGDLDDAARWLGITTDSLRLRLQRHGLQALPDGQGPGPSARLN
jgi:PAS domain-containing protein